MAARGGPGGKPVIAAPASTLRFSLSHTDGAVACAVADGVECGIDVEPVGAVPEAVGELAFTAEERTRVACSPEERRAGQLTALWTLKEAYGKATGEGLTARVMRTVLDPEAAAGRIDGGWRFRRFTDGPHLFSLVCECRGRRLRPVLHRASSLQRP
ncbi:hypothetical protein GCM10029992_25200 [Glycomyces albus]